ncbi:MAG: hypothetical protein OHK006_23680 [Thermodesulfovibrionales bacterium]
MKTLSAALAVVALVLVAVAARCADPGSDAKLWGRMCSSCHDGSTAPAAPALREKYPSQEAFAEAVRSKGNRCMNILKNDPGLIEKIAREIGVSANRQER